jgi:hypothetical protein
MGDRSISQKRWLPALRAGAEKHAGGHLSISDQCRPNLLIFFMLFSCVNHGDSNFNSLHNGMANGLPNRELGLLFP